MLRFCFNEKKKNKMLSTTICSTRKERIEEFFIEVW